MGNLAMPGQAVEIKLGVSGLLGYTAGICVIACCPVNVSGLGGCL